MRRLRRCKIIATIGPASANKATLAALFTAGADVFRINMSHATHDADARAGADDPRGRRRMRPPDRHSARPAGPEAAHRRCSRIARSSSPRARPLRSIQTPSPATRRAFVCRIRKSCARWSPATRCSSTTARCGCMSSRLRRDARRRDRRRRGRNLQSQGRQPAGHRNSGLADDRQGPRRSRGRPRGRRRLGRRLLRAAARRCRRGQEADARPRRW